MPKSPSESQTTPIDEGALSDEVEQEEREDMARDIVVFLTFPAPHYGSKLHHHLECLGKMPPNWLHDLIPNKSHTPPLGCFAEAIAKLYGAEINE